LTHRVDHSVETATTMGDDDVAAAGRRWDENDADNACTELTASSRASASRGVAQSSPVAHANEQRPDLKISHDNLTIISR